jgi:hypothetical protein
MKKIVFSIALLLVAGIALLATTSFATADTKPQEPLDAAAMTCVFHPCQADLNCDGIVNEADYLIFRHCVTTCPNLTGCPGNCSCADFDCNGVLNTNDLLLFTSAWGTVCGPGECCQV